MRRFIISTLICLVACPALAESQPSALPSDPSPASQPVLPAAAAAVDNDQNAAKLDSFPTLSEISEQVFGMPVPRPRPSKVAHRHVPIEQICSTLASAAQRQELPIPFFIRLIWQESRFDPGAVSPVGAQGLAQFMPQVAYSMGLDDPFDPLQALHASARLLRDLLEKFGNNLGLAAAAYNAGPKRISNWLEKRGKLPEETRNYVRVITGEAAERWRKTKPGQLALSVPEKAPCHGVAESGQVMALVPAPLPATHASHKVKVAHKSEPASGAKHSAHHRAVAQRKGSRQKLILIARKALGQQQAAAKKAGRVKVKLASNGRKG